MSKFIQVYKNSLSDEVCNSLIKYMKNEASTYIGRTSSGIDLKVKDSLDCWVKDKDLINELDKSLHTNMLNYYDTFSIEGDYKKYTKVDKYLMHSFKKPHQGYHDWHMDRTFIKKNKSKQLVSMWYLNDVEEGGETEFLYQELKIKPERGTQIIFPADWTHTHKGNKPISNDKYIVNQWVTKFVPYININNEVLNESIS